MRDIRTADSYLLRLDPGEEIVGTINRFADEHRIDAGIVAGIGSVHHAVLGYFDRPSGEYLRRVVEDDCEIASLSGNLSVKDGRAFAHLHAVLGTGEFQALAGHLFEGTVAVTCEVVLRALPGLLQRRLDGSGLALLDV